MYKTRGINPLIGYTNYHWNELHEEGHMVSAKVQQGGGGCGCGAGGRAYGGACSGKETERYQSLAKMA